MAVTRRGLVYRHDPASGRDPELKSCPGSLKPVQAPEGALLLFISPDTETLTEAVELPRAVGLF
ncbi:hypothetical protein AB0F30_33430 [Streptomyces sp. NPDC029006]|uniref:hypothetical protein n=1 Tax=Streptomyces sp. NPDC029006 TaxID=3155467 RepID=UPI0033F86CCD